MRLALLAMAQHTLPTMIGKTALLVVWMTARAVAERPDIPPEVMKLYDQKPVIELATMGVGSLIWERHGHIALCVRYDNPREDACYNYGVGDFHDPVKMGWGFFRGANSFWVAREPYGEMIGPRSIYQWTDRTIWVQPLPLTPEQKTKIIAKLDDDVLEEHKYYAYDHFWDNCTTRVRDILDDATGGALSSMTDPPDDKTYRDLARDGFFGMPGSRIPLLITDVAMGRVTDRVPTYWERMFLPQYLREAVAKKFGIAPIVVYERHGDRSIVDRQLCSDGSIVTKGDECTPVTPSGRVWLAVIMLLITAPAWLTRKFNVFPRVGLWFAVLPEVLIGSIFTFLALISPLPYVRWNETCLVWFPLDILLVAFLSKANRKKYARGRVAMLGLMAILMIFNILKAPLFAEMLWPLIPALVVGYWPEKAAKPAAKKS